MGAGATAVAPPCELGGEGALAFILNEDGETVVLESEDGELTPASPPDGPLRVVADGINLDDAGLVGVIGDGNSALASAAGQIVSLNLPNNQLTLSSSPSPFDAPNNLWYDAPALVNSQQLTL